jgi:hypothetical protein
MYQQQQHTPPQQQSAREPSQASNTIGRREAKSGLVLL